MSGKLRHTGGNQYSSFWLVQACNIVKEFIVSGAYYIFLGKEYLTNAEVYVFLTKTHYNGQC